MSWMQYMFKNAFKIHYIHPYIADNVQNSQFLVTRGYFFEGGIMMKRCLILERVVINDGE